MAKETEFSSYVWSEKYRPSSVKEVILPKHIKEMMLKFVEDGQTTNLLLTSLTPGTGKTSLSGAIVKDLGAEYLELNMSDEGTKATLRETVRSFASAKAFNNKPKIILMDEMGGATPQAQLAFKSMSEELTNNCRFIVTENELHKIIQPLREGRFIHLDFDWKDKAIVEELKAAMIKRLKLILKMENVEFEESSVQALVDSKFPSMRIMIATLQSASLQYGKIDERMNKLISIDEEFIKLFFARNLTGIRQYIKDCNLDERFMYKELFDKVVPKLDKMKQAQAIFVIAESESRLTNFPEIQLANCILQLFSLL